jgi:RimJ/RimL family protein N-acetyltransferase
MKISKFKAYEDISLKWEDNGSFMSFDILLDEKKIGSIEYWINQNGICEINGIELDELYRGRGYGSKALEIFAEESGCLKFYADCVSQESFFTFVKAWGKPDNFGSIFKEFKTYDEVKEWLPLKAPYDKEGQMVGSSDSSVSVYYELR